MNGFQLSRSARWAAGLALAYVVIASVYIFLSSRLAAGAAHSIEELERIETLKGTIFVAVTGALAFVGAYFAMRRFEHDSLELVRRERALISAEGRVFAGLTASSVAHDANNTLTALLAEIDELSDSDSPDVEVSVQRLKLSARRLVELNRRLMNASRQCFTRGATSTDLLQAARQSVAALRSHAHVRGCTIEVRGELGRIVVVDPVLLNQIVSNLVLNAGGATGGRGRIEVRVGGDEDQATLEVHDDGPGVPLARRADLFDALFTTKPDGNGFGFFSVKACVKDMGGTVEVVDSPLGGALFCVHVPTKRATTLV